MKSTRSCLFKAAIKWSLDYIIITEYSDRSTLTFALSSTRKLPAAGPFGIITSRGFYFSEWPTENLTSPLATFKETPQCTIICSRSGTTRIGAFPYGGNLFKPTRQSPIYHPERVCVRFFSPFLWQGHTALRLAGQIGSGNQRKSYCCLCRELWW